MSRMKGPSMIVLDPDLLPPCKLQWGKARAPRKGPTRPIPPVESTSEPVVTPRVESMLEVLDKHWAPAGEALPGPGRHAIVRALGGWLARDARDPWSNGEISALVSCLPSDKPAERVHQALLAAKRARAGDITIGWSQLSEWLGDAATELELAARSDWWVRNDSRRASTATKRRRKPENEEDDSDPEARAFTAPAVSQQGLLLILRSRDGYVTLLWEGDERGHRPIADSIVRNRIRELGYDSYIPLSDGSRQIPVSRILEEHGATYESTRYAFTESCTRYDPSGEGSVTIGYALPAIEAKRDPEVEAWLTALAGPHIDRLNAWIASCAQRHIGKIAACVVLVGPADIGKSMFAHGLCAMWGAVGPSPLALIIERFNGDMLRCPILYDEEAQLLGSKELSTKRLRDIVQSRARTIEKKGKEKSVLLGAQRFAVGCNALSDIRLSDLGGDSVISALTDRLLVIDATSRKEECKAALERLRVPGAYEVDLRRIAAHMAWLGENFEVPVERFIGGGGESEVAILAGHVAEYVDAFESFREWLDQPSPRDEKSWLAHEGHVYVAPAALLERLVERGRWDLPRVNKALEPFLTGDTHRPRSKGTGSQKRPRYSRLDHERLATALRLVDDELNALVLRLHESGA